MVMSITFQVPGHGRHEGVLHADAQGHYVRDEDGHTFCPHCTHPGYSHRRMEETAKTVVVCSRCRQMMAWIMDPGVRNKTVWTYPSSVRRYSLASSVQGGWHAWFPDNGLWVMERSMGLWQRESNLMSRALGRVASPSPIAR